MEHSNIWDPLVTRLLHLRQLKPYDVIQLIQYINYKTVLINLLRCLNGIPGTDCVGETLNSKPCDSFTEDRCSYWSGWGEWTQSTTCPDPITKMCTRRKTRTCYGRNTDMCDGPTVFEKTEACEYPSTNTKIIYNPPERCCPCDNPDCGEKIVTEDNPCFSQQPGPTRIPVPMPLCEKVQYTRLY